MNWKLFLRDDVRHTKCSKWKEARSSNEINFWNSKRIDLSDLRCNITNNNSISSRHIIFFARWSVYFGFVLSFVSEKKAITMKNLKSRDLWKSEQASDASSSSYIEINMNKYEGNYLYHVVLYDEWKKHNIQGWKWIKKYKNFRKISRKHFKSLKLCSIDSARKRFMYSIHIPSIYHKLKLEGPTSQDT